MERKELYDIRFFFESGDDFFQEKISLALNEDKLSGNYELLIAEKSLLIRLSEYWALEICLEILDALHRKYPSFRKKYEISYLLCTILNDGGDYSGCVNMEWSLSTLKLLSSLEMGLCSTVQISYKGD